MTTLTVRSYHMADVPFDEAAARERDMWSVFGQVSDPRPDGRSGLVVTDVTVTGHAETALRAAVARRAVSQIIDPKDPA